MFSIRDNDDENAIPSRNDILISAMKIILNLFDLRSLTLFN
jgi:hypothetical protein